MKKLLIFTILASLLLLSSCAQIDSEGVDLTQPFIGGTIGLNAYLLEGLPPPIIQDNSQSTFSIAVVLENQGEADVGVPDNPFVQVTLVGINPQQWSLTDADTVKVLAQPLRGARKNFDGTILPGELTTVAFENMMFISNIRGNVQYTLRADICYDYTTVTSSVICIKDDVLENIQDSSLCTLTGEKGARNSGGPLQVTSIVQNPLGQNRIQVNFVIEHVGFGEFYGRVDGETCNPSPSNFNKHQVQVILQPLSDPSISITCSRFGGTNQGTIKLFQGAPQTISCTLTTDPDRGRIFQDLLEIELRYRYGQFIETPILVQDVGNEPGAIL